MEGPSNIRNTRQAARSSGIPDAHGDATTDNRTSDDVPNMVEILGQIALSPKKESPNEYTA